MSCFSIYLFSFFLLQNWRTGRWKKSCTGWEGLYQWEEGSVRERGWEGEYSAIKCVHKYVNAKMILVESTPGIWRNREGMK
jgi:hypothetical protein